ncbi:SUKH-3 domain-containing protein [Acinetobacter rudis]|uniref:SUKH-3 domain-containing protein n=1 Tax=Acinetobacter rudis TaxID=632955 RepID=UPI00333ED5BC
MSELVLGLDPEVEKKLEKNGWYKARNGDLTQTINQWNDDGYKIFNSAQFFLKSFNNLRVQHEAYASNNQDYSYFDGIKASRGIDPAWVLEDYFCKVKVDLLPIGLGYSEHLTYFIDPSGNFYGGYDDYFCKIGDSINSFFDNIFFKKNFESIN